ncbi:MAG: autotransporter outer membrane beta-barrel domain-containing protein [Planctomycetota bacterium]|nr:autotransporter outer membrane beta-barrel domain-containing protein [Planctomycetota bacterium]
MRKLLRPLLAMSLVALVGAEAIAGQVSGFGNSSYGSQMSYDSFNFSVRKRLQSVRLGSLGGTPFGGGSLSSRAPADTYGPDYAAPGASSPGQSYGGGPGGYNRGYNQGYNANPAGYAPAPGYNDGYNSGAGGYNSGYGNNLNTNYNPNNYGANGYSYAFSSDSAYAMAPSSRASSVASARRRQLDCVYYSGFTVWGDLYQTWARQRSTGRSEDGYNYRTFGPAVGLDWTSGPVTVGVATTYNWGKLRGRDIGHDQKIETWAADLYAQYNADNFYINGSLGYGHNKFDSDRSGGFSDRFSSNSLNIEGEFGWKMNWNGLQVIPTAGVRYFHDRRGNIDEGAGGIRAGTGNYHVFEVPLGVNLAYEINGGGMVFVPRARMAWIPELDRVRGSWSGTDGGAGASGVGARRSRHGFQAGLGLEGRFTETLSAHVDYNINFRSKQYEHHWNLGMGFSF